MPAMQTTWLSAQANFNTMVEEEENFTRNGFELRQ